MKPLIPTSLPLLVLSLCGAAALAEPPPEPTVRGVFAQVLSAADTDQDGTLTFAECKALLSDPAVAQRNCRFWDADKDGVITEDEYVERVRRVTARPR